ncbi:MAG: mannose-1-phosphate guanylyltransferase [Chloroflexota bacterium]
MKRCAVIMAGGSGERFWPLSRRKKPKQLLNLSSDDKSMIEEAIDRIRELIAPEDIYIITGDLLVEPLREALTCLPSENIVAEPRKRNTAPCLALAAAFVEARYEDLPPSEISMAVLTADQRIMPVRSFLSTVDSALNFVENTPYLGTIGIVPARPETGYGYIEVQDVFEKNNMGVQIKPVVQFREKPSLELAEQFVKAGNFLWNSGMFFWRLDTFEAAMIRHLPEVGEKIASMRDALIGKTHSLEDIPAEIAAYFEDFPDISIDYGLMERSNNTVVARAIFTWDDIGAWDSLERVRIKDENENIVTGCTSLVDVTNSIVINATDNKMLVAALGLEGFVVVATDDAVLICPKDRVQEVKKCVEKLKYSGMTKWL